MDCIWNNYTDGFLVQLLVFTLNGKKSFCKLQYGDDNALDKMIYLPG